MRSILRQTPARKACGPGSRPLVESLEGRELLATLADLAVMQKPASMTAPAGGMATFMINAENLGPGDAKGITVEEQLPLNVEFIAASANGTFDGLTHTVRFNLDSLNASMTGGTNAGNTMMLSVDVRPLQGGNLTAYASITSPTIQDPDPSNNTASASVMVEGGIQPPKSDVSLTADLTPGAAHVGDEVTYTLTVKNQGPDAAQGVIVTASIPKDFFPDQFSPNANFDPTSNTATFTIDSLPAGESRTLTIMGRPEAVGPLLIRSLARTASDDTTDGNNTAMASAMFLPSPAVSGVTMAGIHHQPTELTVNFTSGVTGGSATNVANYTLVGAGRDRSFGTRDDLRVPIYRAFYDPSKTEAILIPAGHLNPHQNYRLTINGAPPDGIANGMGVPLLGNQGFRLGAPDVQDITPYSFSGPVKQTLITDPVLRAKLGVPFRPGSANASTLVDQALNRLSLVNGRAGHAPRGAGSHHR